MSRMLEHPNGIPRLDTFSRQQLIQFGYSAIASLQTMAKRAQLLGCELQRVDKDNKIFDWTEGVLDKPFLYIIRKALKEGDYEKMRDGARIKRRNQAPGHQKEL